MSTEKKTTEYISDAYELFDIADYGVTEAEVAEADRLLRETASLEDQKVDYGAMLRRIKEQAMEQGLAAGLAKPKADNKRAKRILRFAASAAAVLVLGMGVLGAVKAMSGRKAYDNKGDVSAANEQTEPAATQKQGGMKADETPELITESADNHAATESPLLTPLPTEAAVRGGVRGYTYIAGFETPAEVEELYENRLPGYMTVEPYDEGLGYSAKGYDENGDFRYIDCRVCEAAEGDLPAGVAVYTVNILGNINFTWRVNEKDCMHFSFEGFKFEEAEEFLRGFSEAFVTEPAA